MTVNELKEMLDDFGDHLTVVLEYLDDDGAKEMYFDIGMIDTGSRFFESLVIGVERIPRPE